MHGEIISDIDDILELILHTVKAQHLFNEFFDTLEDTSVPTNIRRLFLLKTCCGGARSIFIIVKDTDIFGDEVITLEGASLMDR